MKNILVFILALFIFSSCQQKPEETELPSDMASLRLLEKDTKTQVQSLKNKLKDIKSKMIEIDPSVGVIP